MIVHDARRFLESVWPDWHREYGRVLPAVASAGTCGRSATFLHRALRHAGRPADLRHGWFGTARHAWVGLGPLILDVTADQFGAPPVLLTGLDDPRYRIGTDTALPEFQAARAEAVAAVWDRWLAFR